MTTEVYFQNMQFQVMLISPFTLARANITCASMCVYRVKVDCS